MKRFLLVAALAATALPLLGASEGCGGTEATRCKAGAYACGPGGGPAGGPACCSNGYNCCFGYNVCCDENHPWYGGGRCWASDPGNATLCGKPAN